MYEYRQILVRMRQGESDRELARAGLIGRKKAQAIRARALLCGWLDASLALPDDAQLAAVLKPRRGRPATSSAIAPYRAQVEAWVAQGIAGTTIYRALVRNHRFAGSYSAAAFCNATKRPARRSRPQFWSLRLLRPHKSISEPDRS